MRRVDLRQFTDRRDRHDAARNGVRAVLRVAANANLAIVRFFGIADAHRQLTGRRSVGLQVFDLVEAMPQVFAELLDLVGLFGRGVLGNFHLDRRHVFGFDGRLIFGGLLRILLGLVGELVLFDGSHPLEFGGQLLTLFAQLRQFGRVLLANFGHLRIAVEFVKTGVLLASVPLPAAGAVKRGGAREQARHRVVLARRNRIELVVVATSTRDGQRHEAGGRDFDLLGNDVHLEVGIVLSSRFRAEREKAGRN